MDVIKLSTWPGQGGRTTKKRRSFRPSIVLAALSIPGIHSAVADTAPERAVLAYKYLDYQDSQPGWKRIGVDAHAMSVLIPIAGEWSVGGSYTSDTVSGASPSFRSKEFLAGTMEEHRTGSDFNASRYFSQGSLSVGVSNSRESDYFSNAFSISGSISTESKNTTLNFGYGKSNDRINVPDAGVNSEHKKVEDLMLGITQVLTPNDIVQLNFSHSSGHGYFSDPYKFQDNRPDSKKQFTVLSRWNHHFSSFGGTGQFGYRYYDDSFGITAHTLTADYVQPISDGWTITPMLRLYQQSAASFYLEPDNPDFPTLRPASEIQSQDQRLSAFGALTVGLKISKKITPDCLVDLKFESYEQRSKWYLLGKGSEDIKPFRASIIQAGISYFF